MKRLLLVAAIAGLWAGPLKANDSMYTVVFNSERVICAKNVQMTGRQIRYCSVDTGQWYGVPGSYIWRVVEIDSSAREFLEENPEVLSTCVFGSRADIEAIAWEDAELVDLIYENPESPHVCPPKDDGGILANFYVVSGGGGRSTARRTTPQSRTSSSTARRRTSTPSSSSRTSSRSGSSRLR